MIDRHSSCDPAREIAVLVLCQMKGVVQGHSLVWCPCAQDEVVCDHSVAVTLAIGVDRFCDTCMRISVITVWK